MHPLLKKKIPREIIVSRKFHVIRVTRTFGLANWVDTDITCNQAGFFLRGKEKKERLIHLFHIYFPHSSPFFENMVYNIQHVHQSYSII